MHIIYLTPLTEGIYNDHCSDSITTPPEGWAYIPEDFPLPSTFPRLGSIEAKELTYTREMEVQKEVTKERDTGMLDENGSPIIETYVDIETVIEEQKYTMMTVTSMTKGSVPDILPTLKIEKEKEISDFCNQAIITGMDVETSQGLEHFSLQETDQINLTTATNAIQQGFTEYPYHADGQLCRMFTAEEILSIADAATKHKLYHTTLCNHLLTWVRRAETKEELDSISYSEEALPEDLKANMVLILSLSSL